MNDECNVKISKNTIDCKYKGGLFPFKLLGEGNGRQQKTLQKRSFVESLTVGQTRLRQSIAE